jgi:hypothetical protein
MSGGGKGGSTTSSVEIPAWLENAAQTNLARADQLSTIGYTPYYGADVAALTPMQQASMQNTNQGASAFGMAAPTDAMAGMPQAQTFAGGVQGYSSGGLYDQALSELQTRRPGQFAALNAPFINPYTGAAPAAPFGGGSLMPANQMISQGALSSQDRGNAQALALAQAQKPSYNFNPTTQVISSVSNDQRTGVEGQDVQYYNPSIDYNNPYVGSNNQVVGTLNPSDDATQAMQDEYGIDPNFYTENPIYSASDFPLGSSLSGTDYTNYSNVSGGTNAINDYGSTVNVGYDVGQVDPGLADAAGYNPVNTTANEGLLSDLWSSITDPNYDPAGTVLSRAFGSDNNGNDDSSSTATPAATGGGYTSLADMFDGGGAGGSGDTFGGALGGLSNTIGLTPAEDNNDDSSDDSGTLICTAMNKMGLLPDDIYALDAEFGLKVNREDRMLGDGYRLWALPVSEYIKRDTICAKALRTFMRPITLAWAKEMAHKMRPEEYKTNYAGKVIMAIGHPICRAIGYAFIGGLAKKDA